MKTKATGRLATCVPVSMTPEMKKQALERVKKLKPRVSSFSNYIQQLIQRDMERDILASFNFNPSTLSIAAR